MRLEAGERTATAIKRFSSQSIPGASLLRGLERLGWVRGELHDHGDCDFHSKPFYASNVTAVVVYDPRVYANNLAEAEPVNITDFYFVPDIKAPTNYDHYKPNPDRQRLKLGEVDPVVLSEVLKDVTFLAPKRCHDESQLKTPMGRKKDIPSSALPESLPSASPDLQRPAAEVLYAEELRRLATSDADAPRPRGWRLTPRVGPEVRPRRRRDEDRSEVRRAAELPRALRRRAGHQPRPDAHRRAGHGQELSERAAGGGHQRRLDAHHPGQRRHHRGQHQVFVELRPAAGRGADASARWCRRRCTAGCSEGKIVRFEEITRCPLEIQDMLLSILSDRVMAVPELRRRGPHRCFARAGLQRHRHGQHARPRRQRDERRPQAPLQLRDGPPDRRPGRGDGPGAARDRQAAEPRRHPDRAAARR